MLCLFSSLYVTCTYIAVVQSLEISSINSDSSGSSTASFHSLNNDLTPVASEAAKTSSMQLLKESVGTVLLISANKASTSSKQKTKYYDCISETSCSSSGVNSPALDPNLTKLSRGSKIGELLSKLISIPISNYNAII